jgi:hypothetical protein
MNLSFDSLVATHSRHTRQSNDENYPGRMRVQVNQKEENILNGEKFKINKQKNS